MASPRRVPRPPARPRPGFTLTDLLIVVAILAVLMALLLPALSKVRAQGQMTVSMSNMRQIGLAMGTYARDYREQVLSSQFNHHADLFVGHPRCLPALAQWHARGTWADILWTTHHMGVFPEAGIALGNDYHNDSPDKALYDLVGEMPNPLRSPAPNSRDVPGVDRANEISDGSLPTPYGGGATEKGYPGYFAANNFFNDDVESCTYNPDGPFSMGQIRAPNRSVYLIDSFAGEVIEVHRRGGQDGELVPDHEAFDNRHGTETGQVDFRYAGAGLLLLLDGHVQTETAWGAIDDVEDLADLEQERLFRLTRLTGG